METVAGHEPRIEREAKIDQRRRWLILELLPQEVVEPIGPPPEVPAQWMRQSGKVADWRNGRHEQEANAKILSRQVKQFALTRQPVGLADIARQIIDPERGEQHIEPRLTRSTNPAQAGDGLAGGRPGVGLEPPVDVVVPAQSVDQSTSQSLVLGRRADAGRGRIAQDEQPDVRTGPSRASAIPRRFGQSWDTEPDILPLQNE